MKNKVGIIALGLWVVTIAIIAIMMIKGSTIESPDERVALSLTQPDRDFVAKEMRSFVMTMMTLTKLISENKLEEIPAAARKNGQAEVELVPPHIMVQLPMDFKKIGFQLHDKFDALAEMAEAGKSKDELLGAVADLYVNCVSCHSTYRVLIKK